MRKISHWAVYMVMILLLSGCGNNDPYNPDYTVSAPFNCSATDNCPDRIELDWEIADGNDLYCNIYREPGINSSAKEKIGDTGRHHYEDKSALTPFVEYTYYIEPVSYSYKPGESSPGFTGTIYTHALDARPECSVTVSTADNLYFNYKWYNFSVNPGASYTIEWIDNNAEEFTIILYTNTFMLIYSNTAESGNSSFSTDTSGILYVKVIVSSSTGKSANYYLHLYPSV